MSRAVIFAPRALKKMQPSLPKFPPAPVITMCLPLNLVSCSGGMLVMLLKGRVVSFSIRFGLYVDMLKISCEDIN